MVDNFNSKLARGKKLHSQAREIIWRVSEFMQKDADAGNPAIPLNQHFIRTAVACGVSLKTVHNVRKEKKDMDAAEGECSFQTPKKAKRNKYVTELDNFDKCVVRRTVYNCYKEEKCLPTISLLRKKLKESIGFSGSSGSLRTILRDLGFKWKKIESNRKLLIERSDIREKRIEFLIKIKQFREAGRPIVYIDESYILSSHVMKKGWVDDSKDGYKCPVQKGQRAIMLHAGGDMGFIPNALLIWKAGTTYGDYHNQMNHENFMKWVENQLLPNLPVGSVIVIDNASYHNVELNKAPSSKSKKEEMIKWLLEKGIDFDPAMLKPTLLSIINASKTEKVYALDDKMNKMGHTVLRLPPYHPDLNAIEMIWALVKNYVAQRNVNNNIADTIALCKEKFEAITKEEWRGICNNVICQEEDYYEKERVIDYTSERFIITENSSDESSGTDEEDDENSEEVDLAEPL